MKKIISALLVLVICFNLGNPMIVQAIDNIEVCPKDVCAAIVNELSVFEQDKASVGLSNVNFNNLYVSGRVPVYEYTSDGFTELSSIYLLFENDEIVTLMYEVEEARYQIMSNLAIYIKETGATYIAVIYDINGCYLYDGLEIVALGKTNMLIDGRKDVIEAEAFELSELSLTDIGETQKLNYISNNVNTRAQANVMCSVSYVTQGTNDRICWAATTACIVNYIQGKSLTASQVAIAKWGSSNYNRSLEFNDAILFMNSKYNMNYIQDNETPKDNVILSNIQNGYPIYGSFNWMSETAAGVHGVTIYGINVIAQRIMIMDPEFGSATAYYGSNGYTYVNHYSGATLTFARAGCKIWPNA